MKNEPTDAPFPPTKVFAILSCMGLALAFIFILGVANFMLHRAVIESGHPLISQMRGLMAAGSRGVMLFVEFAVLLCAMLLAVNGWPVIAWAYAVYSALNGIAAWLILTRKI